MPPLIFDFKAIKERCDEISPHTMITGKTASVKKPSLTDDEWLIDEDGDGDDPPGKQPAPAKKVFLARKK